MKTNRIFLFICFLTISGYANCFAQQDLLQAGPMLGYNEMREVAVWVQTKRSADVSMSYWDKQNPGEKYVTQEFYTTEEDAFTAHLIANKVLPGKSYYYDIMINGTKLSLPYPTEFTAQKLWQFREDPPEFSIAFGSCAYVNEEKFDRPGNAYGGEYKIFEAISEKKPDLMLWLGDNVYLREADWFTMTGIQHRNTHTRSIPELQPLLAATHHYAIWDDHDFGPNDADRSFVHKDKTLEAFRQFWANPGYGINGKPGLTSSFKFNDIDFFMLDNRYYRSPNKRMKSERQILGREQIDWLIDALCSSRAPYKLIAIGGQVLNTAAVFENYATYAKERKYLLDQIKKEKIKGVIFLSGDRHHSELSRLDLGKGLVVYDFTSSPLTAGVHSGEDEKNKNRVEGTHVSQRNFGLIRVSGPYGERVLELGLYANDGSEIWSRKVQN